MSTSNTWSTQAIIRIVVTIVFTLAVLFGVTWLFIKINGILVYFLAAAIISLIGRPIVDGLARVRMGKFGIPTGLRALIALACIYAVFVVLGMIFVPLISKQAENIASIDTQKAAAGIQTQLQSVDDLLLRLQGNDTTTTHESVQDMISGNLQRWINATSIRSMFSSIIGGIGNLIVALFSITFISFFFLRDQKLFYNIVMIFTPDKYEYKIKRVLGSSKKYLTRYFIGLVIESIVVMILISGGLYFLGIGNYWLIGFFAGLVNVIPYIGPIIGMLFGMLIAVTSNLDMDFNTDLGPLLLKLFILFEGVQLIDNYVSQPIIFSNTIHAHPLEVFFIVLVFGTLAGIPGMIVAMPVYAFFRIIAREFFSEFTIVKKITKNIE